MEKGRYTYIFWDWNGTLLNDAWLCVDVMNSMLAERGLPAIDLETYRAIFDFPVRDYYTRLGFDFGAESFEVVGMEFMVRYNKRQKECRLHQDAEKILDFCRQAGLLQYMLSAREENELREEVRNVGIQKYFAGVFGLGDHYAHGKTDVGHRLLKESKAAPEKIIFIGDSLHDAEVAAGLGIDCLLIPRGHQNEARLSRCGYPVLDSLLAIPLWL